MSDNVERTPEARWKHLRENGRKSLASVQSDEPIADKPEWLDEQRFVKAREAVQRYLIGVQYSSFTGLLLILQLPDGLEPLLTTGNSKDIPSLYRRYLNTILHINSWYETDVFDPQTKGFKSIRQVRAMHRRVQSRMNEKFEVPDEEGRPHLWMSHYDVAMTQWAFIGLAMIYPKKSAMIAASREDLELINYYWRVLGHLMGVADEFNACQFDHYDDIQAFHKLIFEHEYMDKFKTAPCKIGLEMTQSICVALQYYMPLVTFNCLAHWWKDCFQFNGYQPQPMSGREKVLDFWTRLSFNHLLKNQAFLKFSNKLHKSRFDTRLKNRDKVYEKLKEQYKDDTKHTYYSERVDYFARKTDADDDAIVDDDGGGLFVDTDAKASPTATGCPFGFVSADLPPGAAAAAAQHQPQTTSAAA